MAQFLTGDAEELVEGSAFRGQPRGIVVNWRAEPFKRTFLRHDGFHHDLLIAK